MTPFALVADVDEDLVLVDPDDLAGDDVTLLEGGDGRVVVGDDLAVDLEQQSVGAFDDVRGVGGFRGNSGVHVQRNSVGARSARCDYAPGDAPASDQARRGSHPARRRLRRARLRRLVRRPRGRARAARDRRARAGARPLRDRRAPDLGVRRADELARAHGPRGVDPADLRPRSSCTPRASARALAAAVHLLDLRLPAALRAAVGAVRRRRVRDRQGRTAARGDVVHTDRGDITRAADRRRARLAARAVRRARRSSRPTRRSRAAWRSIPSGSGPGPRAVAGPRPTSRPATRWAFAAGDEMRIGVGAYRPARTRQGADRRARARHRLRAPARYQGNWIPHRLRPAAEDGVFFVGDSAGHCFPVTAEGIRPALVLRRRLRARDPGRARGPPVARAGAAPLRRRLRGARGTSTRSSSAASRRSATCTGPCWRPRCGCTRGARWRCATSSAISTPCTRTGCCRRPPAAARARRSRAPRSATRALKSRGAVVRASMSAHAHDRRTIETDDSRAAGPAAVGALALAGRDRPGDRLDPRRARGHDRRHRSPPG